MAPDIDCAALFAEYEPVLLAPRAARPTPAPRPAPRPHAQGTRRFSNRRGSSVTASGGVLRRKTNVVYCGARLMKSIVSLLSPRYRCRPRRITGLYRALAAAIVSFGQASLSFDTGPTSHLYYASSAGAFRRDSLEGLQFANALPRNWYHWEGFAPRGFQKIRPA